MDFSDVYTHYDLLNKIERAIKISEFPSFAEYLAQVDSKKRRDYQKGYDSFIARCKIPMNLQIVMKPDEKQFKDSIDPKDYKARNIFNPSNEVKAVIGYVAWCFMRAIKEVDVFKDSFVQGWNSERLEHTLAKEAAQLEDPQGMCWDGSNHDAHQHADFIESVDNMFIRRFFPLICAKVGFNVGQTREIVKKASATKCQVTLYMPNYLQGFSLLGKNRFKIFSGKLIQTTFSGHPTRTTLFNTLRILLLQLKIGLDCGAIAGKNFFPKQSGDDTFLLINSSLSEAYGTAMRKYYAFEEGVSHGYGQLCGELKYFPKYSDVGYTHIDFLSKNGFVTKKEAVTTRQCRRIIATGDVSAKIGVNLTEEQLLSGIKAQLLTSYVSWPMYKDMIDRKFGHVEANSKYILNEYKAVTDGHHHFDAKFVIMHPDSRDLKILEYSQGDTQLLYPQLYKLMVDVGY